MSSVDNFVSAVGDDDVDYDRFVSVFFIKLGFSCSDKVVVEFFFNEVDSASAKTTAHDARACDATFFCDIVEVIEFNAAYFVEFGHTFVCLIHAVANGFEVAFLQCVAYVENSLFLIDNVFGSVIVFLRDLVLDGVEHLDGGVAQSLNAESLSHAFARFAALIVGRVNEFVLYFGVE